MPPRENDQHDITLDQVRDLSGVLIPIIRDALGPEFRALREDFILANAKQAVQTQLEFDKLDARVGSLERFRWKLAGMWALACAVASFGAELLLHLMAKK